ncbi:MAG: CRISPR-associated protein Cas5 [Candidatus Methanomethylophilaceae archaeon]|nr:CRISPR-associated protein Cas5 [Candidatus Methanomethylophilaceae archaeon]
MTRKPLTSFQSALTASLPTRSTIRVSSKRSSTAVSM